MFHREEELRLTAVHGFLLLLHGTADADRAADGALQFQLELLGFIRRSFSQQASTRTHTRTHTHTHTHTQHTHTHTQ